jgi:hypothetical protein
MEILNASWLIWSKHSFAMTAAYHWLFVPLHSDSRDDGPYETTYVRTGDEKWRKNGNSGKTIFGINFASAAWLRESFSNLSSGQTGREHSWFVATFSVLHWY